MAKDKKSFVLYGDQRHVIDLLSNEQAGILLKHLFAYVNDENPVLNDQLIEIAFEPMKQQLKRDLVKYQKIKEKRSIAGAKGGKAKQANARSAKQKVANQAVNGNDNVNVNEINNKEFELFWSKYPRKVAKGKCQEKFNKLSTSDKQQILDSLDAYIKYKPFEGYNHPNPETYLNQKRWLDELPNKQTIIEDPVVKMAMELNKKYENR